MVLRVSLFIDYQNVYHGARRIFHQSDAHNSFGQVSPRELGEFLCRRRPTGSDSDERQLQGVRVYRGTPPRNGRGYAPALRQHAAWRRAGVTVVTRPLQRGPDGLQEKGIDVELALDFFAGAIEWRLRRGHHLKGGAAEDTEVAWSGLRLRKSWIFSAEGSAFRWRSLPGGTLPRSPIRLRPRWVCGRTVSLDRTTRLYGTGGTIRGGACVARSVPTGWRRRLR